MVANYTTLEEVKTSIERTRDDSDALLELLITNASRAIDNFCNRPDGFVADDNATERVFAGSGERWQYIDEAAAISTVKIKETADADEYVTIEPTQWLPFSGTWDMPDFNRIPYNGIILKPNGDYDIFTSGDFFGLKGFAPDYDYGRILPTVAVTARWGNALTVPGPIKQATIITVSRWFKRSQGSWQDDVAPQDFGTMPFTYEIDRDVKFLLKEGRYVRPAV